MVSSKTSITCENGTPLFAISLAATMAGLSRMRVVAPQPERSLRRCLGLLASRAYGSAAAALAYDYDYCYSDVDEPQRGPTPRLAPEGSKTSRGVQWVMIGEPGVKKHVFAERLAELLEVPHISMGSLVRQELHPSSSLYKQVNSSISFSFVFGFLVLLTKIGILWLLDQPNFGLPFFGYCCVFFIMRYL